MSLKLAEKYYGELYAAHSALQVRELACAYLTLHSELKNFIGAFDTYFEMRGGFPPPASKVDDAKQAMFSAAMSARELLGKETK